jgi:outer membrane protein assembly factor BamD
MFNTKKIPALSSKAKYLILLFLTLFSAQCSHVGVDTEDPESLFKEAEETFKDERYLIAMEKYRDIKNRFPYSKRAIDSELRIADSYFEMESYLEAESVYEIFRELHPTHPKSDYVQYQIAMSYFNLIPENSARDLSAAYRAIDAFDTLRAKFPDSSYSPKGTEKIVEIRKKLADHELYVADFYFARQYFLSASYRYETLLRDYEKLGYDESALYRLGQCYYNTHMLANAKTTFKKLIEKFPGSPNSAEAQSLIDQIGEKN